jgi:hypothetical protein
MVRPCCGSSSARPARSPPTWWSACGPIAGSRCRRAGAPPPLPPPGALPVAPPPPAAPILRGDTAASAVPVPVAWRDKLAAGTCGCGQPLAIASDEALRYDGRLLVVVRLTCAACGHARSVYLAPAEA